MDFDSKFNIEYTQQWTNNITIVMALAVTLLESLRNSSYDISTETDKEKRELIKKIENACKKAPGILSLENFLNNISEIREAAYAFAKDPLKQNFAETFQYKYVRDEKNKPNIKKLSSGGKSAIYLVNGEMVTGLTRKPSGSNATKSIDFQDGDVYYYAKVTNGSGGAQDNQCNDGKCFIEQANIYASNHQDQKKFILLVNGTHYTDSRKELIRNMISQENRDRVFVYGCDEL